MHTLIPQIDILLRSNDQKSKFLARQLLFMKAPLSKIVELYLYDNDGNPQKLDLFPMMRPIYDQMPQKLILKCSRKTLKSTLLSNLITLNLLRYNYYSMMYVAPQELSTKHFSQHYLEPRLESPPLKKILTGYIKNDVFEKELKDTRSSVLLRYARDDATRLRGPSLCQVLLDEAQDIDEVIIPIIYETMAILDFKREIFAGTPLTTDNSLSTYWNKSSQLEWATKCTGCNHWNTLTEDNEPLKMIRPAGLSCSKCSKCIDTLTGQWVCFNPGEHQYVGYHLAQPILPFFNSTPDNWKEIYNKVENNDRLYQVYNEVFGIAYDVGSKPISEDFLKTKACVLGKMGNIEDKDGVYGRRRYNYRAVTCGVDWGVNMATSRTTVCIGGLRDDMVYEVFFAKIFKDFDYEHQIKEIARMINKVAAFCASDAGPDPNRGILLTQMTSPTRSQLVRYDHGKFIQQYQVPTGAIDWRQNRWCLHRSDTMSFTFTQLLKGLILLPQWGDIEECMRDILNIFTEVKEGNLGRQELFYRHKPDAPDDFFHALNFAVCQAHLVANNPLLNGPSSSIDTLANTD